jgi:hypothetical protein
MQLRIKIFWIPLFIIIYVRMLSKECLECFKEYTDTLYKWCKPCQINHLKENFTNWTSKNEQIDKLIQEKQLSINNVYDTIFEWIPYDQFNDIKKSSNAAYSTKWKDGPLLYNNSFYTSNKYTRNFANKAVILKYLVNSPNITYEFLNEVCKFFIIFISNIFYDINIF